LEVLNGVTIFFKAVLKNSLTSSLLLGEVGGVLEIGGFLQAKGVVQGVQGVLQSLAVVHVETGDPLMRKNAFFQSIYTNRIGGSFWGASRMRMRSMVKFNGK
jgi:hypothetical protein